MKDKNTIKQGIVVTGFTYWLQVWTIEKKGPVFTALYTPLALIITCIVSTFLFKETLYLGRLFFFFFLIKNLGRFVDLINMYNFLLYPYMYISLIFDVVNVCVWTGAVWVGHCCWCVDYTVVCGVKPKKRKYKNMRKSKANKRLKKLSSSWIAPPRITSQLTTYFYFNRGYTQVPRLCSIIYSLCLNYDINSFFFNKVFLRRH